MDADAHGAHHAPVRVLPHITKLDDSFGDFLVRVRSEPLPERATVAPASAEQLPPPLMVTRGQTYATAHDEAAHRAQHAALQSSRVCPPMPALTEAVARRLPVLWSGVTGAALVLQPARPRALTLLQRYCNGWSGDSCLGCDS